MSRASSAKKSDVVIIGGGLAGPFAATLLAKQRISVTLVEARQKHPDEFRAEQLVGSQVDTLRRLGLFDMIAADAQVVPSARAYRGRQLVARVNAPHYGIPYGRMVNNVRAELPASVQLITATAVDAKVSNEIQTVTLSDGRILNSQLVMVATGHGQKLHKPLGIQKAMVSEEHSLAFGMDVQFKKPKRISSSIITMYAQNRNGYIDYATIFPVDGVYRINVFTHGILNDQWSRQMVQNPVMALKSAIPSFENIVGEVESIGKVAKRPTDLMVAEKYPEQGAILIGDAFQTSCPAAGTGISRLLNDVEIATLYVPEWLKTRGMGPEKIGQYYGDPKKVAVDAEALHQANYRRLLTTGTGIDNFVRKTKLRAREFQSLASTVVNGRIPQAVTMGALPEEQRPLDMARRLAQLLPRIVR